MAFTDYVSYPNIIAPANWVGPSDEVDSYVCEQKDLTGFWNGGTYGTVQSPALIADNFPYAEYPLASELINAFDIDPLDRPTRSGFITASVERAYRGSMFGLTMPNLMLVKRIFVRARPRLNDTLTRWQPNLDEIRLYGYDADRVPVLPTSGITLSPANLASLVYVSSINPGEPPTEFPELVPLTLYPMGPISERIYALELENPLPMKHLRIASVFAFMDLRILGLHLDATPVPTTEVQPFWTGFVNTRERPR